MAKRRKKTPRVPVPERHGNGYREKVTVNGTRYAKTFPTFEEAYQWGLDMMLGRIVPLTPDKKDWTVGGAVDNYIKVKRPLLKKSTIAGYERIRKNRVPELMATPISAVTKELLEAEKGKMEPVYSKKSVKDTFALITASLKAPPIGKTFDLAPVKVPKPRKEDYDINDIPRILTAVEGTTVELPVNLALRHGLRMSEELGLKWKDFHDRKLNIFSSQTDEGFEESTKEDDVSC